MKADPRFRNQPKRFWANVRTISQHVGYTDRKTRPIRARDLASVVRALEELDLGITHIVDQAGRTTKLGKCLIEYFAYRAKTISTTLEPNLMNAEQAEKAFKRVRNATKSKIPVPMNKQKGDKKKPAFLTAIVNMLIDANRRRHSCDFDPHELTTFTRQDTPLRTLARRIDGAFPSAVNPVAVWEIKEYYYTTTFGSRVADGVYESLLDGMELEELRESENINCKHYLIIDAHYTWCVKGKSYLRRIVDVLHMGYVDEVLVGIEVLDRMPSLTKEWVAILNARTANTP